MQHVLRFCFLFVISVSVLTVAYATRPSGNGSGGGAAVVEQIDGPKLEMAQGAAAEDAVAFTSTDGKFKGWKVAVPGNRPLATPAVVNGRVFIGGGFGSHEF